MCLMMTYTELVVTENESMHPNIEFTHQIKVCYYLKANKADCIEPGTKIYFWCQNLYIFTNIVAYNEHL